MSLLDKLVVTALPLVPKTMVRNFAAPYIAGAHLSDAVSAVRDLNRQGFSATIDVLGEAVSDPSQIEYAVNQYLKVLHIIEEHKLDANISIKPTQLGLGLDPEMCRKNYLRVIEELSKQKNFLRIDMEDSPYTTLTFDLFDSLRKDYDRIGLVIQAYMRRSITDLRERLIPAGANIRICKGIYIEPPEIAYKDFEIVRKNFLLLLEEALEAGLYVGIATHDEMLIWEACRMISRMGLAPERYEFQMLLGVGEHLRRQIIRDGHRMRVYVPFGRDWYAYSTRRLKENPKIAGYVIKDILKLRR